MSIHIGCGSWADPEYVGVLYPKDLPSKDRLRGYAQRFDRVEVNSSYYATPSAKTVASWIEETPPAFIFDVKLHRAFSQSPKKAAEGDLGRRLLDVIGPLAEKKKLGTFLLTLAPFFGPDRHALEELDGLVEMLRPHLLAVELRHRAWVEGGALVSTLDYFRSRKLVWVALDFPPLKAASVLPAIDEVTNPKLAYMRLHGRNRRYLEAKTAAERHDYAYTPGDLKEIAARARHLDAQAKTTHVTFNNHAHDYAPQAALAFRHLLEP